MKKFVFILPSSLFVLLAFVSVSNSADYTILQLTRDTYDDHFPITAIVVMWFGMGMMAMMMRFFDCAFVLIMGSNALFCDSSYLLMAKIGKIINYSLW